MRSPTKSPGPPSLEAAEFQHVRPRLFGIAYQMLGRAADAEDVVQEVWLRWQGADRALVRDRVAFLVKITTRVTINFLRSARVRREVPVDHWLPGQVLATDDPTLTTERSTDVEHAVVLLLQRLSPTERAVFVLREAFDYPFRDIAEALQISEANARQLRRRAHVHLSGPRREPVQRAARDRLVSAFLNAAQAGAVAHFERLLADDVRSQLSTKRTEQVVRGQSELGQQSGVVGVAEVDPVRQVPGKGLSPVGSVCAPDDVERVGLRERGHGASVSG